MSFYGNAVVNDSDEEMLSQRNKLIWAVKRPAIATRVQEVAKGATPVQQWLNDYGSQLERQPACCNFADKRANSARPAKKLMRKQAKHRHKHRKAVAIAARGRNIRGTAPVIEVLVARFVASNTFASRKDGIAKALAANGASVDETAGTWIGPEGIGGTVVSAIVNSTSKRLVENAVDAGVVAAALSLREGAAGAVDVGTASAVLFLDCDGVLATVRALTFDFEEGDTTLVQHPGGTLTPLERRCLAQLRRVVEATDAMIVLSTTWRLVPEMRDCLTTALEATGMRGRVLGDTPKLSDRGAEVGAWLAAHPEVTRFAILDDGHQEAFAQAGLSSNLVCTLMQAPADALAEGLTIAKADEAIALLGGAAPTPPRRET